MSVTLRLYQALVIVVAGLARIVFPLTVRGRIRLAERYGHWNLEGTFDYWLHGASVGEMQGLIPLLEEIQARHPQARILITSTSPTGLTAVEKYRVERRILPFDAGCFLRRALGPLQIKKFIFGETEIWPELLRRLQVRGTPAYLVNARISDHTISFYRKIKPLIAPALRGLKVIAVQSAKERERFISLGAREVAVHICGSAKYDKKPTMSAREEITQLRQSFFTDDRPVVTLGSLRPGEEEIWFPAIVQFLQQSLPLNGMPLGIIIAPRHQERFEYFAAKLQAYNIPFIRRSTLQMANPQHNQPVVLLDSLGELEKVYSFSLAAFIGATLVEIGGHNPLEAAAYGVTPVIGPYAQNISEIEEQLRIVDGYIGIQSARDAQILLNQVAAQSPALVEKGIRAKQVWQANCGATQRIINLLGLNAL